MRVIPIFLSAMSVVAGLGLVACRDRSSREGADGVIAVVGGEEIRASRMMEAMRKRAGSAPDVFLQYSNKLAVLDEVIETEVLLARARADGFIDRPDVAEAVRQLVSARYKEELIARSGATAEVDEAQVRAFYEANPDLYRTPESARWSVIFLSVPEKADDEFRAGRRALAEQLMAQARGSGAEAVDFGSLAAAHSDDQATRYKGGDAGLITRTDLSGRWPTAVLDALFALREPGSLAGPVDAERGIYLIRLQEYRPADRLPFEVVRLNVARQVELDLQRQTVARAIAEGRQSVKISIREEALKALPAPERSEPVPPTTPPGMPGG